MALTAAQRRRLPASAFAIPSMRLYPINTLARARNALARAAQKKTRGSYATVAAAVRRRYGSRIASLSKSKTTRRRRR